MLCVEDCQSVKVSSIVKYVINYASWNVSVLVLTIVSEISIVECFANLFSANAYCTQC